MRRFFEEIYTNADFCLNCEELIIGHKIESFCFPWQPQYIFIHKFEIELIVRNYCVIIIALAIVEVISIQL